jgi:hypothetical protein
MKKHYVLVAGICFVLLASAADTALAADDTRDTIENNSASENLRVEDPMQPSWLRKRTRSQATPVTRTRFSVDTIVVSPQRRVAVINGRSVGVGDKVNGARVLDIEPNRVTLDVDGRKLTIELTISNIKTVAKDGG